MDSRLDLSSDRPGHMAGLLSMAVFDNMGSYIQKVINEIKYASGVLEF